MKTLRIVNISLAIAFCGALSGYAAPPVSEADIPLRPTAEAPPGVIVPKKHLPLPFPRGEEMEIVFVFPANTF